MLTPSGEETRNSEILAGRILKVVPLFIRSIFCKPNSKWHPIFAVTCHWGKLYSNVEHATCYMLFPRLFAQASLYVQASELGNISEEKIMASIQVGGQLVQ